MTVAQAGRSPIAAGWHGKLPSIGDFASRRLNADFVKVWDEWLSSGLAQVARQSSSTWLDSYLSSPPWRFVVTPGFLPAPLRQQIWTGVVMPSVDRVGRYYPLTLACNLDNLPPDVGGQSALWSWLHRLEDLAVDAVQDDWSINTLESELERLGLPILPPPSESAEIRALASISFFELCCPAGSSKSPLGCFWYSEGELPKFRSFVSPAMDHSVLRLWSDL